jgi:hypothetical protein
VWVRAWLAASYAQLGDIGTAHRDAAARRASEVQKQIRKTLELSPH